MSSRKQNAFLLIISSLLLASLLAGCAAANHTPAPTATPAATAVPPTPTTAPSELIWVPAGSNPSDALVKTITDFAAANSLQYRTLSALTAADITTGTKIVIIQSAPADLITLAAGAASTQFIVLGGSNPGGLSNVSSIQAKPEDEAFMAGYLTMLISQDWRASALLTSDGPIGSAYADDFANGSRFVCGKCNPFYSPLVSFPAIASEPTNSPSSTWTADAISLSADWLSAAFITPSAVSLDVASALSNQNINTTITGDSIYLISTVSAPQNSGIQWAALLDVDYSSGLKELLPQVLAGKGNLNTSAQITLTNINPEIVSPAKQALFNQTASDLAAGLIIPTTIQ